MGSRHGFISNMDPMIPGMTPQRDSQNTMKSDGIMGSISKLFGFGGSKDQTENIAQNRDSHLSLAESSDKSHKIRNMLRNQRQKAAVQRNPYDTKRYLKYKDSKYFCLKFWPYLFSLKFNN